VKSAKLDKTVMLLSADWFMPSWSAIGLNLGEGKKVPLQQGCREIVKQLMSGAQQYWFIDFSLERVAATNAVFQALVDRVGVGPAAFARLSALIGEKEDPTGIDENTQWLVVSITEQVLDGSLDEWPLSQPFRQILDEVQAMWNKMGLKSDAFDLAGMASTSAWDEYLRSCTPDIPSMLSDYASSLVGQIKFSMLWQFFSGQVPQQQRDELIGWYRKVARSIDEIELVLPVDR